MRASDLERQGVSRTALSRLVAAGSIERVGRGLYSLPGAVLGENHSLAEVSRKIPRGVVCLLSALRFHDLTTQNPFEVWLAIDQKAWRPRTGSQKIRLLFMSGAAYRDGVETHNVHGVPVRVYSAAKTVADCFKFRNTVGIDVAVEALRDFSRQHRGGANDLARFAKVLRVQRVMQPYMDSIP
jgi:predicted transcriptional regulator of viral defense system